MAGNVRASYEFAAIRLACRICSTRALVRPHADDVRASIAEMNGFLLAHRHLPMADAREPMMIAA